MITNEIVIKKAAELGFDLVGFAKIEPIENEIENLNRWLNNGYHASMEYMIKNLEKRSNPKLLLDNAKSIISLGLNYYTDHLHKTEDNYGKVSRYAWGKDYHLVIWEKLALLEGYLKELDPQFQSKSYVDTGPVMDKVWAVKSGIGWLGKHSNVINRDIGSWFFIATIITNFEFESTNPITDHCGTCTACIDACPTKAIVDNYVVDSNKCISFLTIENKKEIDEEFKNQFDNWLFGCDICQDVCPWNNKFSEISSIIEFEPKCNKELNIDEVLSMNGEEFKTRFETSPIFRAKLKGLKRNAAFLKK
ncbi:MAG: tRNA epoxyqueuosine(34) reductase QueG [Melioribacteraceae bacterium]|jgi:epoxyqueuosine reductase|nr:tRNA epoxyqueuosine(34) reductase QueG [Melioribacteraceae bacterium]